MSAVTTCTHPWQHYRSSCRLYAIFGLYYYSGSCTLKYIFRTFAGISPPRRSPRGQGHRTRIGSRSRQGHHGDVRDALDGSSWTFLGAGNRPPAFRHEILHYWAGTPNQHSQTNSLYRRMRIGAAQREFSGSNSERFMPSGYGCVPRAEWLSCYSTTVLPDGAHFRYKGNDGLWWLVKISASTTTDGVHLVRFFWTTRGRSSFLLLRHATRLRQERYKVLGVYMHT